MPNEHHPSSTWQGSPREGVAKSLMDSPVSLFGQSAREIGQRKARAKGLTKSLKHLNLMHLEAKPTKMRHGLVKKLACPRCANAEDANMIDMHVVRIAAGIKRPERETLSTNAPPVSYMRIEWLMPSAWGT